MWIETKCTHCQSHFSHKGRKSPNDAFHRSGSRLRPCPAQELIEKSAGHKPSEELLAWGDLDSVADDSDPLATQVADELALMMME